MCIFPALSFPLTHQFRPVGERAARPDVPAGPVRAADDGHQRVAVLAQTEQVQAEAVGLVDHLRA